MGYIEKRGENKWRLVVVTGYKSDGSQNRERENVTIDDPLILKSEKKIKDYLNKELLKFEMKVQAGNYVAPEKMLFKEFIGEWREKYAKDELAGSTLQTYEGHIEVRLIPVFGHMRMDQIKPMHVLSFIKDLEKPGARKDGKEGALDSGTVGYIYRVLKNVLSRACEWKVISENPMEDIPKPKPKNSKEKLLKQRENPQYYNEKEAQQVVDALYNEPSRKWRLLILGSMFGGFRRGELVGLEWPYVLFDDQSLNVENNIPLTKNGQPIEKGPKSDASYRIVDMPEWYMEELALYYEEWKREKERLGTKWEGGDRQFVFHNGKGRPYYYQHPYKWWKRFCARNEIRFIKFHGLRHSTGTLLLEDEDDHNVDSILKAIQERLGHSRLSTTSDIYVHLSKKVKKKTAGKYDKFSRKSQSLTNEVGEAGGGLGEKSKLRRIK
ncbi:Tyrosine recombinase XerD [compost metagenome]